MANARTRTSTALTPTLATLGTPGSAGTTPVSDGTALSWDYPAFSVAALRPTGAISETYPRFIAPTSSAVLASGSLRLLAVPLPKGVVITSISVLSGSTALSVGLNQWFGLFDSSRVCLRVTADDTSTAWSSNTVKTLNLTSTFTTTYTGLHYIGVMVNATTPPSLVVPLLGFVLPALAPIIAGDSSAGQTTPFTVGATAAAITAGNPGYAYVS